MQSRIQAWVLGALLLALVAFPSLAGASPPPKAWTGPNSGTGASPPSYSGAPTPGAGKGATGTTPPPLAATPPMGWDSWDTFGCGVNQTDIEETANWLVLSGMRDAGYRYVIIDDCWFNPTRALDGSLRADGKKFPNGMRWLGWYLHSHGLLFGIYASAGPSTCAQLNNFYPGSSGSLGHEQQDARTFASWGVDYLKFDWCSRQTGLQSQIAEFTKMRDALRATGRPIVYSINPNSFQNTPTGASYNWTSIANVVRTGPDTAPFWDTTPLQNWFTGIVNELEINAPLWGRAGPGHWNDPDILVVGLRGKLFAVLMRALGLDVLFPPNPSGAHSLSFQDMRTNMAMWAMMTAPLIVGYDVRYLSLEVRRMLLNKWLIAIDQDPLGRQARRLDANDHVWVKPLSCGTVAAALFNQSNVAVRVTTTAHELGLPKARRYSTVNVWNGNQSATTGSIQYVVPAHGTIVYLVAPVIQPPVTKGHGRGATPGSSTPGTATSGTTGTGTSGTTGSGTSGTTGSGTSGTTGSGTSGTTGTGTSGTTASCPSLTPGTSSSTTPGTGNGTTPATGNSATPGTGRPGK